MKLVAKISKFFKEKFFFMEELIGVRESYPLCSQKLTGNNIASIGLIRLISTINTIRNLPLLGNAFTIAWQLSHLISFLGLWISLHTVCNITAPHGGIAAFSRKKWNEIFGTYISLCYICIT